LPAARISLRDTEAGQQGALAFLRVVRQCVTQGAPEVARTVDSPLREAGIRDASEAFLTAAEQPHRRGN
jgi:hypothetical protein